MQQILQTGLEAEMLQVHGLHLKPSHLKKLISWKCVTFPYVKGRALTIRTSRYSTVRYQNCYLVQTV